MERRLALTLAGTAAIVITAGTAAVAANLGILDVAGASAGSVGQLDAGNVVELVDPSTTIAPTTTTTEPQVVYVDEYDGSAPEASSAPAPSGSRDRSEGTEERGSTAAPVAPASAGPAVATPPPTLTSPPTTVRHHEDDDHETPETPEPADD